MALFWAVGRAFLPDNKKQKKLTPRHPELTAFRGERLSHRKCPYAGILGSIRLADDGKILKRVQHAVEATTQVN